MIEYASPTLPKLKPVQDSFFCIPAFLTFLLTVMLQAGIVGVAYHRSPTYWCERFEQTVGHRDDYISLVASLADVGMVMGLAALLRPFRKRAASFLAIGCNGTARWHFGEHWGVDYYPSRSDTLMQLSFITAAVAAIVIIMQKIRAHRRSARINDIHPQ